MARRLCLEVPNLADAYAVTLLDEALGLVEGSQMWSFQLQTAGWLTPGLLFPTGSTGQSVGTITTTPFQNTIVGDATSSAAWLAYILNSNLPFFNQLQIRSPYYSLYSIISFNLTNPAAIVLTLDRPWMEPGGSKQSYMIYQAYFACPVANFKRFLSARDTTNSWPMDYVTYSQRDLAVVDPERTIFDDPNYIVPFQVDTRPGSATFGNFLFELWPHPLSVLPYTFQFLSRGPSLILPSDTVPYPLTEEALLWRAKECAYVFKEAQKGEEVQRGSGANWQFLAEQARDEFKTLMKPIKDEDRDLCELYFNRFNRDPYNEGEPFSTITGGLNVGRM